jgi:hypothetical protein
MTKELEALKHIISEINNCKLHGIGDENWLGFQDVLKDIDILEKVLTPPTADEVCKALSKWVKENILDVWNCKVYYDNGGFHYYNNCDFEEYLVEYERIDKAISLSVFLPPHLVTMIGKFYDKVR